MKIIIVILCLHMLIVGNYCHDEYYESKRNDHSDHHAIDKRQATSGNINITLYTRSQPNGVVLTKTNNFANAAFSNSKVTKFTTNGWTHDGYDYTFSALTKAYLNKSDLNVINYNWATWVGDINGTNGLTNFNTACTNYTDLLTSLIGNGASATRFHMIGHGLGAHVSGCAAQRVFTTKNVKVNRLTGLDPTIKTVRNLTSTDAEFVDIIHTSDTVGTYKALGSCDFYPNNGKPPQAGCGYYTSTADYCSHYAGVNYFVDSIRNATKFLATSCGNYELYKDSQCRNRSTTYMGESVDRAARGSYYLSIYLRNQTYQPYP